MTLSVKRFTLLASSMLASIAVAGCNMAPHYVRPDLPVAPAVSSGIAGSADSDAPSADSLPIGWQDYFTDARLRQVITLALGNNRDLRIAMANVEQARAQTRVQGADLFPTIAASGSADYERTPRGLSSVGAGTRTDIYRAQLGVSAWEIDLFGRVRNLTSAAQEQYFASADNRSAAQVTLVAEVANAWLQLGADREQLTVANDTAATFAETLTITQGRAGMGVSSDLDVKQAQTTYEQARADVARLTTTVAQDRNALDLLAGIHVEDAMLPASLGETDATLERLPAGLSSRVLLKRPDVSSAEHQLKAANADIGAARAAFFPQISLTAALGTLSLGLSNLFGGSSHAWSVQPSASLPIFDAGRNTGNLRYAKATRDAMVATYEKSIQTAFREVADALARRETIEGQLDAERNRSGAARDALEISRARYREGVDPFLTTLDSERTYYTAQQSLISTRLEKQNNAVELFRALGGGNASQ